MSHRDRRIAAVLREAELSPPQPIPTLAEPQVCHFESSAVPSSIDEARSLLVQQRISEPGYQHPDQQKRHIFRSKKSKEANCNTDNWIFSKHEVARAFDHLLSLTPLPMPGVAQALLSHATVDSLEELWCHFHHPTLEKSMQRRSKSTISSALPKTISSVFLGSSLALETKSSVVLNTKSSAALETPSVVVPQITWLDEVCGKNNLDYIRLMCQAGLKQDALNRAFTIALSNGSIDAMRVLLSFGAVASACQDAIRVRVRLHDVALVRLLLSAPNAMSVEAWRCCVEPRIQGLEAGWISPDLLLLCLAHRGDVICKRLLLKALESQNLPATAIMLAYGYPFFGTYINAGLCDIHQRACEFASRVQDHGRRHKFFTMLVETAMLAGSGFVAVLPQELMKDVKIRQLPLIKLLVDAGVCLDTEPYNAFYWAVENMDLDVLELFKWGKFSQPTSKAVILVPDSISESDMLRLVKIGGRIELADGCLIRAVRRRYIQLVDALISDGVSNESEQASAIQIALGNADLDILSILLRGNCSATTLSTTLPFAMVLKPRPIRLQAMKALVEKGVLPQELGDLLQRLVSEDGDVDSELIQLLLQHKAPVDGVGDDTNNVVLVAAQRGHLSILRMLCDSRPQRETLSKAVPVAFGVIDTCGYNVTLDMIKLLLQNADVGLPTHRTLLAAAEQDSQLDIVRLLLEHGADANYASGASFGVALRTSNFKLLQILCKLCPPSQESTTSKFFMAIDPRYYNSEALELLLSSTRDADATMYALWSSEKLKGNPNITTIVPCLLRHGLNVDLGNGRLLSFAIREKNVTLLDRILSANPSKTSLTEAFHTATNAQPRSLELEIMGLLLEKAKSAEIGQSISLLQQTHCALSGDYDGLLLLLRHKAVASPSTFTIACLATESSTISWNEKQQIFEYLLAASAKLSTEYKSKLLAYSVMNLPECTRLPQLLLTHGAEVEFETLAAALEKSSLELFDTLVSRIKSADIVRTFKYVQKTTMVLNKRYPVYEHLLGKGIPSDDVSEVFLDLLRASDLGDSSILKLLLENGASPGYQNCKAFSLALRANNLVAVRLLIQYLVDDSMATVAFDIVRKSPLLNKFERVMIYRPFLEWNISKSSISQVLVASLKDGHLDLSFLRLLLSKGADPNIDNGLCFTVTSKVRAEAEFRALSKYAKPEVIKVLLNNFKEEREVIRWFKVCLEEQPQLGMIDQDGLVFQCMRKFPGGADLLKLLLDQGASASAKIDYSLCAGWKPEPCTALIWALFSKPRIENNVILILLSRGDAGMLHVFHIVFPYD